MPTNYGRKQLDPTADPLQNIAHTALGEWSTDADFAWVQEFRQAAQERPDDPAVHAHIGRFFLDLISKGDAPRLHKMADALTFAVQNEDGTVNDRRGLLYARYSALRSKATEGQRLNLGGEWLVKLIKRHEQQSSDYVSTKQLRELEAVEGLPGIDEKEMRILAKSVGMRFGRGRPRKS